jgi:uncharacterized protein YndB with AHSA1/START domain
MVLEQIEKKMNNTIETIVHASIYKVWRAYTSPEHNMQWNAASDD